MFIWNCSVVHKDFFPKISNSSKLLNIVSATKTLFLIGTGGRGMTACDFASAKGLRFIGVLGNASPV